MSSAAKRSLLLLAIAYLAFVNLGLPDGAMGVAWPTLRRTFGLPLDAIAPLFLLGTAGGMLASFNSGRAIARWSVGPFVLTGCLLTAATVTGFALAPAWVVVVALSFFGGLGAGAIDAGLNTFVATRYTTRHVNWLHGCWGLGVSLGPLLMTGMLAASGSWRAGYAAIAVIQFLVALCFALTRGHWRIAETDAAGGEHREDLASRRETLRRRIAWVSMLVFFVYSGTEIAAGQWFYSLFVEARAVPAVTAGLWVALYWASLTAGRFLIGAVADRIPVARLLRLAMGGAMAGALLLCVGRTPLLGVSALVILGASLATIFPSMMSETPLLIGRRHAPNAIGFQVAAAGLGIATLPGAAGVLARRFGLETLGPFLLAATAAMFLLHEARARLSSAAQPPSAIGPM